MSITVTVTDDQTGETETTSVRDGDYVLICTEPCHVASQQAYPAKGTHVLTIKGRTAP